MTTRRITRVNELIRREIGSLLFRIADDGCDLTAVTVTHVIASPDLRDARVLVSVRGDQEQKDKVMRFLRRKRGEIQADIGRNIAIKYTPRLVFALDESLVEGDRVIQILNSLEAGPAGTESDTDENETERPL